MPYINLLAFFLFSLNSHFQIARGDERREFLLPPEVGIDGEGKMSLRLGSGFLGNWVLMQG